MRRRDRLVWGLVGALSFLVLVQGYELAAAVSVAPAVKVAVAFAVAAATLALAPLVERRLDANESA